MNHRLGLFVPAFAILGAGLMASCSPEQDPTQPEDSGAESDIEAGIADSDFDGISDVHESCAEGIDSDTDGTPDCLDLDSDDDLIPDAFESGSDGDPSIAPRDSDGDGIPDFRDVDSDDNGLFDRTEGYEDIDNDGLGNCADSDNDGDRINDVEELGGNPSSPVDSDGDGTADYIDTDSDNDHLSDLQEYTADTDEDGTPDRLDDDSDGDGIPDSIEAGDEDLETPPVDSDEDMIPDFRDLDSDADGLSDEIEWANASELGTDYRRPDADGDGVSDMIEWAAGTAVGDPSDSPLTRGDFVFIVPYEEDPDPEDDTLDFSTAIQIADVYFLMDRTESMDEEIIPMRNRLNEIIDSVTCAEDEDPSLTGCIPDLWVGFGWFTDDGYNVYGNESNLTSDYASVQDAIPSSTTSGVDESQRKAAYCTAHGPGDSCPSSAWTHDVFPCPEGYIGYPCYRPDAARVLVMVTDEDMNQDRSPSYDIVGAALIESAITFIGIDAADNDTVADDLRSIARASGQAAGSEMVYVGNSAGVVDTVVAAIEAVSNVPFDVGATPLDDPSDLVDATLFIEYLEVNTLGSLACTNWPNVTDSSGDGHSDRFLQLLPGTPVCWDVIAARNTFVEATQVPQMFMATIEVRGGSGETLLDTRNVYFLVPPVFYDPPPD